LRNVSQGRGIVAKRGEFGRKWREGSLGVVQFGWRAEAVPRPPGPGHGPRRVFDAWLGKRESFRITEFYRNKTNVTIHSGTCAGGASLR
jgi:hypothetical protein